MGTSACASRLVEVGELEAVPQEFTQKITDLKTDIAQESAVPAKGKAVAEKPGKAKKGAKKLAPVKVAGKAIPEWQPAAWPYGIGEVAEYSLRYGLIEGGVVVMKTLDPKMVDGEKALHYSANVRSTKLLELFYRVDDTIDTFVSMDTHLPIRQDIQQRESAQWGNRAVTFNRKAQTAKFYATTEKKDKKKKVDNFESVVNNYAQDIFGALYFFRFVEPRERVNFAIHDRGKDWSNETTYLGTDDLDLPVGRTRARHYKLQPRISGNLETKGDVEAWFSDDERRILVRFRATIKFGSVTGDLRKYQPGKKIVVDTPRMRTPIDLTSLGENQSKR